MVTAMVVMAGGKDRSGKHQQEQGGSKHLFHARTVARILCREKIHLDHASSQTTGQPIVRHVSNQSSPNQPFRTEMPSDQFNHHPGQRIGSPMGKNQKQNAERMRATLGNRSAHAGQNQQDSIETRRRFQELNPTRDPAPLSASARVQIAIHSLIALAPSRAPIVPQRQEKTPRSRRANHTRFRSGPGQA